MGWWRTLTERLRLRRAPLLHIAGDVGDGPVIVLVHGIASSAATFRRLVPLLENQYRCISLDILGFGRSPAPETASYTVEEHVAAIHETVRSLGLVTPFVLVGHSLGSLLSARYAALHPERISRLVLVSPPVYLAPSEISDPRVRRQVGTYLKVYEFMRENKTFTMSAASRISQLFQLKDVLEVTERNWIPFMLSLKNCIESQTTVNDIAAVRVPIDVVYGAQDQFIAAGTMNIIEKMRHVTMHRVEASGHLLRNRLARAIAGVLDE